MQLHLNSLGDAASRNLYREALLAFFEPRKQFLSKLSQQRYSRCAPCPVSHIKSRTARLTKGGVMRILDSKELEDIALVRGSLQGDAVASLQRHLTSARLVLPLRAETEG